MNRTHASLAVMLAVAVLAASAPMASAQTPATKPAVEPAAAPAEEISALEQWIHQTKKPVDWLSWGADLRLRDSYLNNAGGNKEAVGHERHWQNYRTRLWATATPFTDFDINARLVWEFGNYCRPEGPIRDTDLSEALFDNLNVKWKNVGGQPLTLTVGRQDIALPYWGAPNMGWLVFEGTPLDAFVSGSRTIYFDAARATYEAKPIQTTFDAIFIDQYADENKWIEPFNHRDNPISEQDSLGVIVQGMNRSIAKTELGGYVIYKKDNPYLPNGNDSDIVTFGARASGDLDDNWKYYAEIAPQVGHKNLHDLCALGGSSYLAYWFNDPLKNKLRMTYEFMSGDDPDTQTNESFDILWGRWARGSDLIAYLYAAETRIADFTNLHRLGPGWTINPCKNLEFCADYWFLFADENTFAANPGFSNEGKFRGQLITTVLKYRFTDHITGHLQGEVFCPGNYYSDLRNDVAVFARYELIFTW